jgi:hypothetical protein
MKTKFFFFLAMLLMSSVGAFAQSESKTPLKGDAVTWAQWGQAPLRPFANLNY